jgi:hypothetical protein
MPYFLSSHRNKKEFYDLCNVYRQPFRVLTKSEQEFRAHASLAARWNKASTTRDIDEMVSRVLL